MDYQDFLSLFLRSFSESIDQSESVECKERIKRDKNTILNLILLCFDDEINPAIKNIALNIASKYCLNDLKNIPRGIIEQSLNYYFDLWRSYDFKSTVLTKIIANFSYVIPEIVPQLAEIGNQMLTSNDLDRIYFGLKIYYRLFNMFMEKEIKINYFLSFLSTIDNLNLSNQIQDRKYWPVINIFIKLGGRALIHSDLDSNICTIFWDVVVSVFNLTEYFSENEIIADDMFTKCAISAIHFLDCYFALNSVSQTQGEDSAYMIKRSVQLVFLNEYLPRSIPMIFQFLKSAPRVFIKNDLAQNNLLMFLLYKVIHTLEMSEFNEDIWEILVSYLRLSKEEMEEIDFNPQQFYSICNLDLSPSKNRPGNTAAEILRHFCDYSDAREVFLSFLYSVNEPDISHLFMIEIAKPKFKDDQVVIQNLKQLILLFCQIQSDNDIYNIIKLRTLSLFAKYLTEEEQNMLQNHVLELLDVANNLELKKDYEKSYLIITFATDILNNCKKLNLCIPEDYITMIFNHMNYTFSTSCSEVISKFFSDPASNCLPQMEQLISSVLDRFKNACVLYMDQDELEASDVIDQMIYDECKLLEINIKDHPDIIPYKDIYDLMTDQSFFRSTKVITLFVNDTFSSHVASGLGYKDANIIPYFGTIISVCLNAHNTLINDYLQLLVNINTMHINYTADIAQVFLSFLYTNPDLFFESPEVHNIYINFSQVIEDPELDSIDKYCAISLICRIVQHNRLQVSLDELIKLGNILLNEDDILCTLEGFEIYSSIMIHSNIDISNEIMEKWIMFAQNGGQSFTNYYKLLSIIAMKSYFEKNSHLPQQFLEQFQLIVLNYKNDQNDSVYSTLSSIIHRYKSFENCSPFHTELFKFYFPDT